MAPTQTLSPLRHGVLPTTAPWPAPVRRLVAVSILTTPAQLRQRLQTLMMSPPWRRINCGWRPLSIGWGVYRRPMLTATRCRTERMSPTGTSLARPASSTPTLWPFWGLSRRMTTGCSSAVLRAGAWREPLRPLDHGPHHPQGGAVRAMTIRPSSPGSTG